MLTLLLLLLYWFFFYLKKKKLKEPDLMENTTPHLKSSPSASFVFFRFAILGHPNSIRATVADPCRPSDKRGGRSSRAWGKGEARSQKNFFRPFGPYFGLKIRAGGGGGRASPYPGSATGQFLRARNSRLAPWEIDHTTETYMPLLFSNWSLSSFMSPFN